MGDEAGQPDGIVTGVEHLKRLVTAARVEHGGVSLQTLAADIGLRSQQHLSQKLNGDVSFKPDELARLAVRLDLDLLTLLELLWPDVTTALQHDPVSVELREIMGRATPAQRKRIEVAARREVDGVTRVVRRRTIPEADHRELGGA